ncbi:MAG: hypothetical protein ACOX69_02930 [Coriobacteriales bacterium]|jgi:prophage antirepressor-like protein
MNDFISDGIEHTFYHPKFGKLRVLERPNGEVLLNADDVARALGMTLEEAVDLIGPKSLRYGKAAATAEDVKAFDEWVRSL